jgi:Metallo-peptidase family M12B Reprolysin-like
VNAQPTDLLHLIADGIVCGTEGRGHATPGGRPPAEIVVDSTQGFIPLWRAGSMLRWRFQERSFAFASDPEADQATVVELMSKALLRWGPAAPVRFTRDDDLWDFEVVLRNAPNCSPQGCVLASAFFPDAGRHELTIFPTMFEQARDEQIETLIHEFGHVFGLRHFFANVSETAWPSEVFGTHSSFSIMNYGSMSTLTDADLQDLTQLYRSAWAGRLTAVNGTPIRFVRPFSSLADLSVPVAAGIVAG